MKLCVVSPLYNGLYSYCKPLVELLKTNTDFELLHTGFDEICFDIDKIRKQVDCVAKKIIEFSPDIIHYNFGTYDSEQLLPYFLDKMGFKGKTVLTYHSLQLDLFKKLNYSEFDAISNEYMGKTDGLIFFTDYAKNIYKEKYSTLSKYAISFHPATHENQTISEQEKKLFEKEFGVDETKKNVALLGYASHWKESKSIVELAKKHKDVNFFIAGPYWADKVKKENPDTDISTLINLKVIDKELKKEEFYFFVKTCIGFFPYHYYKSFQGSGLLPNYLLSGFPCLVNNISQLKEYCGEDKYCFDFSDQELLDKRLKEIFNEKYFKKNKRFSYQNHLNDILNLYREL